MQDELFFLNPPPRGAAALAELKTLLDTGGMPAALAFLNDRVPYRCTAVYRLEGQMLRMIHFHDSYGVETLEFLRAVPLASSFCQFALREGHFTTADAMRDARLEYSPLRPVITSYVGLPLVGPAGQLVGSFCHFDLMQREIHIPREEFDFLLQAMALLPGYMAA